LKRECFVVLELGAAIEPEAGNAHHSKQYRQHIPFLARRKVSGGEIHRTDGRIGKGLGVKSRCVLSVAIVPKTDCILCWLLHITSPSLISPPKPESTRPFANSASALPDITRVSVRQNPYVAKLLHCASQAGITVDWATAAHTRHD